MFVVVIIHALLQCRQVLGTRGFSQVYTFSYAHLEHAVALLGDPELVSDGQPNVKAISNMLIEVRELLRYYRRVYYLR